MEDLIFVQRRRCEVAQQEVRDGRHAMPRGLDGVIKRVCRDDVVIGSGVRGVKGGEKESSE
jgi:hypothetical protein